MMSDETRPTFATVELEPIDPTHLRSSQGNEAWEVVKGKSNRIEIGEPNCIEEIAPSKVGLLTADDLARFPRNRHTFFRLNLSLTLLPDTRCRFRSVDFTIDFRKNAIDRRLPLVLKLKPKEQTSRKVVVIENQDNKKLSLAEPTFKVLSSELAASHLRREEVERIMVNVESFGAGTQQAGWRFRLTDSREIPINPSDLEALILLPRNAKGKTEFIIAAEIDVLSKLDQWLTWAFKRKHEATLRSSYEFPL